MSRAPPNSRQSLFCRLLALFNLADRDQNKKIDREELQASLKFLGFTLSEDQIGKIFERADENGDDEIDLGEFLKEGPKTLRTNLVKLAKKNGNDLGFLV